jgi:DNA-binding response OmpR family regulator
MATVLVVDNDAATLALAIHTLSAAGIDVRMATSTRAALEVMATETIDLILLEVLLPGHEGIETIGEVRQRWPGRSIVAMSGGGPFIGSGELLRYAAALGARATLRKPFSPEELLAAVGKGLAEGGA